MAENHRESTTQLKRVLGFWDLMGASVGQIIGAGIMTLLGAAIAMTGRSVPFAFLIAAVLTIFQYLPLLLIAGTLRLRGGQYTMVALLAGKSFSGAFIIVYIFSNLSLSMYALSFANYFATLFGMDPAMEKIIAMAVLTLFFLLNCMGIDKFAKVQNIIVVLLCIALGVFAAFGIGQIQPGYFDGNSFLPKGILGLLQASGLLTFAIGGASTVINLSAEAKQPTKDIPRVMISSTLAVAVLYGVVAFVAAGVLPVEVVAGKNLTIVAKEILSKPLYIFFIIGGAGFALISTLNAQFAWAPKPVMQACDDGWLPFGIARLSRYNTPIIILAILYGLAMICVLTGLSVAVLGQMCLVANSFITLLINASVLKLPKKCPEEWEASRFKVSQGVLYLFMILGSAGAILAGYLNAMTLSAPLLIINAVVIVGGLLFGVLRGRHVQMKISYEKA